MTRFVTFIAALALAASATSALAQPAISELGAFEAQYPNRDPLNGGALTPAGRLGLELPDGAAPVDDSYAAIGAGSPSRAQRHPSHRPVTGTAAPNATPVGQGGCVRAPDVGEFATAPWRKSPCEPVSRY
jgi:hypothetical protein